MRTANDDRTRPSSPRVTPVPRRGTPRSRRRRPRFSVRWARLTPAVRHVSLTPAVRRVGLAPAVLLLAAAIVVLPAAAGAQCLPSAEGSFSGANQARIWIADSTRAASYLETFDLQYTQGPWLVGLRLEYDEENRTDPEHFQGIARRFAEYQGSAAGLRAGHFYATFGHGLLLRAEEDDAVRIDRDIDGLHGRLHWRSLQGQAFLGRPLNDETHARDDLLAGAELSAGVGGGLRLGAGYVRMDASTAEGQAKEEGDFGLGRPVEELAGGSMQWTRGVLDFFFEGAGRLVHGARDPRLGFSGVSGRDGRAFYGALTIGVPGYTFLIEGKDYKKFDAPYSTLPPANSAGQPINDGRDERGWGVTVTASPRDEITIEAAGSYAEARQEEGERSAAEGSVRRDWWGRGALELGGAWIEETELESHALRRSGGPTLDASYYLSPATSLALHAKVLAWTNQIRGGRRDEYTEVTSDLTLTLGPSRAATLSVIAASDPVEEYENEKTWIALEFAWSFGYNHDLKLKLGEERGGIVCSGGVCHYEPPFSGVRLELTSRF